MKSWILLIVLAVAMTAAATVAVPFLTADSSASGEPGFPAPSATPDGPAPVVEVEGNLTHEFGVMTQKSVGKHGWTFKNTGPGTLELRNLGTDCSCTVAELGSADKDDKTMLPVKPGASEPIELTWNTREYDGAYRKTARIGTNDPHRPEITLAVEGKVHPPIKIYPSESPVNYGIVGNDEDHVRHIAIYSLDRPQTQITRMITLNPGLIGLGSRPFSPEDCKQFGATAGLSIDITLKKGPNLGSFAEEVVIETDHPLKPKIEFTVVGRVTGPISTVPERVVLREVAGRDGGSRAVIIWVRGRPSTQFVVEKKPPGVDVAIEPTAQAPGGAGSKYKMTVKVIPGTPAGKIADDIVLKTDHPDAAEVRIPVDILVQAAN